MPLLVGMGSCSDDNIGVSHMLLEKYGLDHKINIVKNKFIGGPSNLAFGIAYTVESLLTNAGGLIDYFSFNMYTDPDKNIMCKLPNGNIVDIAEFIDNMFIFYLHTTYFLWNTLKLSLGDQSTNNIFIYWLNKNSICGK